MLPPKLQTVPLDIRHYRLSTLLAVPMMPETLLEKLMDVGRALDRADYAGARSILFEAEELALRVQRETIDMQARLSASLAPAYRTVATEIKDRDIFGWKRSLDAFRLRVGRFAKVIVRDRQF